MFVYFPRGRAARQSRELYSSRHHPLSSTQARFKRGTFSCAESDANEENLLFSLMCISVYNGEPS